jgi:uncharacterized protein (TIGR00369 family)
MKLEEIRDFLRTEFAQVFGPENGMTLEAAAAGTSVLRLAPREVHLRPGGIVSGPTLMLLADAGAYAALMSLGPEARLAVTTNLNINFLRPAAVGRDILARSRVLKHGRRLAVIETEAVSEGAEDVLAHTVMTYAMPARIPVS